MKRTLSRQKLRKRVACPICGNARHFAVYVAAVKVHHMAQHAPGRWRRTSAEPRRHETKLPLLLVCESCAHPLGAVPARVLKALP